jgi:hypothetical protein
MPNKLVVFFSACALIVGACEGTGTQAPSTPSAVVTSADARPAAPVPWKANLHWTITNVQWAGAPGTAKSTFGGRCATESDYVVSATFAGEATHAGRITGEGSHCTQITWTPQGPGAVTYSDGRASLVGANGSTITMVYGPGVTGFDSATGETWFEDPFTFTGGTGLFQGATGTGKEGGRFKDFMALLGGQPCPMWMDGTLIYSPSGK